MRRLIQAILFLTGLSASAPGLAAQVYNFPPEVTRVGSTLSFAPKRIAVQGDHLSLVTSVTVDGVAAKIGRKTSKKVQFTPKPAPPGFAEVAVKNPFGTARIDMEFLPTVAVERTGNVLDITLKNGEVGCYVLYYSFDPPTSPQTTPGVFNDLFLDLSSMGSGTFLTGVVPSSDPLLIRKQVVPLERGLIGLPFHIQGLMIQDGAVPTSSYTNLVEVPGLGRGNQ